MYLCNRIEQIYVRKIHEKTKKLLNGYVQHTAILDSIETYIVEPGLGTKSGATGALLLAQEAYAG